MNETNMIYAAVGLLALGAVFSRLINDGSFFPINPQGVEVYINDVGPRIIDEVRKSEKPMNQMENVLDNAVGRMDNGDYFIRQVPVTGTWDKNTVRNPYYVKIPHPMIVAEKK